MQIFINVLLRWDETKKCGTKGIFGRVLAWTEACEEQARLTLHAHLIIWIEHFNKVRDFLFHSDMNVRNTAKRRLVQYFEQIGQATLGDLVVTLQDENGNTIYSTPNESLCAPNNQVIREMQHHIH